jgi:uncharacterized RmlC-like cupin family protein
MADAPMSDRIARFADLRPLPIQSDSSIPQQAFDLIYSRKLLPVIGLDGGASTAVSASAPIIGAAGITITLAVCPPGQGPGLHGHKATFETFTVLQGAFEFRWGEHAEHSTRLACFDTFSVPPGVQRCFTNVGAGDGILQVVISGGRHDASDIVMRPPAAHALQAASPKLYQLMASSGVSFDAEQPAAHPAAATKDPE